MRCCYVSLGFLSLFFFFDLVDELPAVGRDGPLGYQITQALLYVTACWCQITCMSCCPLRY
jgi:hypothetical protein